MSAATHVPKHRAPSGGVLGEPLAPRPSETLSTALSRHLSTIESLEAGGVKHNESPEGASGAKIGGLNRPGWVRAGSSVPASQMACQNVPDALEVDAF